MVYNDDKFGLSLKVLLALITCDFMILGVLIVCFQFGDPCENCNISRSKSSLVALAHNGQTFFFRPHIKHNCLWNLVQHTYHHKVLRKLKW